MQPLVGNWQSIQRLSAVKYVCGYCNQNVASEEGLYFAAVSIPATECCIRTCPYCKRATFFEHTSQTPGISFGTSVQHLPKELESLYDEARRSCSVNAYTGSVLCCRKLLMNIAANQGAKEGLKFIEYVEYLANNGYVPPNGKTWVDHIRKKGNEATHEITLMGKSDAEDLITFTEMLLKFIYEFPNRIAAPAAAAVPAEP